MQVKNQITAVILAGGQSRRFNHQDKGLKPLLGKPLIRHVIERISPQLSQIIISANGNLNHYHTFGLPVISDAFKQSLGPLAGIDAALHACPTPFLLTLPCDTPFLPTDLVGRMWQTHSQNPGKLCLCHDGTRLQPLVALIPRTYQPALESALENGELKVGHWMQEQPHCITQFEQAEAFFNINTPADLSKAESRLAAP